MRLPLARRLAAIGLGAVTAGALSFGAAVPARAVNRPTSPNASAGDCKPWFPLSGMHYTTNRLLGVYVQGRPCAYGIYEYRVAVHNYSPNGVGTRAYGLVNCDRRPGGLTQWRGVYIGSGQTWASPAVDENLYDHVAGLIYPANNPSAAAEVATGCVRV